MVGNWGHVRFRCTAYTLAIQTASLFIRGHDLLIWPISVIHDHSRALFGSNKIRDLSKRLNFAPVMRNFVGMFLLYICTVLALRPERLGLHNLSQAMMVMGISEPQEEQKSVKMLGEPLEWSHWKTWKNCTVWTFLVVPPFQPCEKSGGDIHGVMLSYWVDMLATDSQSCLVPSRLQKDVLLYPSETDTDRENQWLICPQENALQMDSDDGFFQISVPVRVGSIHLPKQLLGQGCQPRTSFLIWTEVGGWYATKKRGWNMLEPSLSFLLNPLLP